MNLASFLARFTRSSWHKQVGVIAVALLSVAMLDLVTGDEIPFSLFYLLPVSLASWLGRGRGLILALLCTLTWWYIDNWNGYVYSSVAVAVWSTAIRLGYFSVVAFLTSALRRAILREQAYANHDALTGALNSRSFLESLNREIERSKRYEHSFTVVYIDLDNFKTINDTFGHSQGDKVLCKVVEVLKGCLRSVDVVARLGGDEFALLLPETPLAAAQTTLLKVRGAVLSEMTKNGWPVSLSVGALSSHGDVSDADSLLKRADALMYEVKHGGKDGVRLEGFGLVELKGGMPEPALLK